MSSTHRIIKRDDSWYVCDLEGNVVCEGNSYEHCESQLIQLLIADAKKILGSGGAVAV